MNPRQIFIERNGDHVAYGWACGKCLRVYEGVIIDDRSALCCKPECEHCGRETLPPGITTCRPCQEARRIERILDGDLVSIDEIDGEMLHDPFGTERWYHDVGGWVSEMEGMAVDDCLPTVLAIGEEKPWELDVEQWVEHQTEEFYQYVDGYPPDLITDYRDTIAEMQELADRIESWGVWFESGRWLDVRPLHEEIMRVREEAV